MPIRNILVPTDFSPSSQVAFDQALELAKLQGVRLHVLHGYWVYVSLAAPDVRLLPESFMDELKESAKVKLEELEKRAQQAGVACTTHLSPLPPETAILEMAESIPADLIVMGTHGHTGLKHALIGSVAERIVRLSHCAVMTVKASKPV